MIVLRFAIIFLLICSGYLLADETPCRISPQVHCDAQLAMVDRSDAASESAKRLKIHYQKDPANCPRSSDAVRRAAFDLGGGSFRVVVADVDLKTKKIEKLFSAGIPIPFRLDLARNSESNAFSSEIQELALAAMHTLQETIAPYAPQQFAATATEAFRIADNGQQLLQTITQETGVPIQIIDQKEEGLLGFLSGVVYSSSDPAASVIIDMGSGSAQITTQNADGSLLTHGMKLGTVVLKDMIARQIRHLETTPDDINPVVKEEALTLIDYLEKEFDALPQELVEKLQSREVRVIATGGRSLNFPAIELNSGWNLLQDKLLGRKTGDGIKDNSPLKGIFIYALIHKFALDKCLLVDNNGEGNTSGLFLTERFWKNGNSTPVTAT